MGNQEQRKGDIARLEWDAQAEERHGAHALATRGSAPHNAELCVNLNAPNTGKMPPTKASNLYSTFPLNPTRLPVTSDMACQKLSFTAHGQHGGSKDQIQWSNPSRFFFLQSSRYWTRGWQDRAGWSGCQRKRSCPELLIWRRKTRRSVHVTAGARALTVSHKRDWKAEKLEVAFAKPSQPLKGKRRGHPVMWNAAREWLKGKRMVSGPSSASLPTRGDFSAFGKRKTKKERNFNDSFLKISWEIKPSNERLKKSNTFLNPAQNLYQYFQSRGLFW